VLRCVGEELIPKQFSTWCPKVFAHIGRIHPTMEDRSIGIGLKRKLKSETIERLPSDPDAYAELRRKAARWAEDHKRELAEAEPALPDINDRARDNWRPLLAIADACSGEWPEEARKVANRLSGLDDDETHSIQLLKDLKKLFKRGGGQNLASVGIVHALTKMEGQPWADFDRGQPITASKIAKLLRPFKIRPRQVRVGATKTQGYKAEQFTWVFKRYLGGV
jgi:Protein of unknown function (DUF3631)